MGEKSTICAQRQKLSAASHSRPVGDVVLANPPPYRHLPWLGMGIPIVSAWLAQQAISSRVVRFLDDPFDTPDEIADLGDAVMWSDPPIAERLTRMRQIAEKY